MAEWEVKVTLAQTDPNWDESWADPNLSDISNKTAPNYQTILYLKRCKFKEKSETHIHIFVCCENAKSEISLSFLDIYYFMIQHILSKLFWLEWLSVWTLLCHSEENAAVPLNANKIEYKKFSCLFNDIHFMKSPLLSMEMYKSKCQSWPLKDKKSLCSLFLYIIQ